ncbi:ribosome maturation factor RimP [Clostridium botulinum]|uniref:ribosome maturation factor RimP n=1 Tax=Clostridium botulinum TaxID=1491 RepID=UPI0006AC80E2|nr:ribosome maturation factor RimP [Clostridium botulinum]AWB30981.1 ribosome maturation factor RimP [Clostridium botulinum]KOR54466.1 ribosome maturation protein RimP [Clostridium botulinum]MBY6829778.1 ribosome maturation factor RimP [Clostridium botulinum]MBY6839459.1 ribosome maturation factor RimP [Clostridium botulinum]MBY6908301.1 ribosome maturation factor RimP [Clostridium botulinum]
MSKHSLIENLKEQIGPIAEGLDYELYHIEFVKEGKENYLRIYIDSENGVSLEGCEKVSRAISELLDDIDPIQESYYLEVSSPGIDRVLYTDKHLEKYKGYNIVLNLYSPIDKKKKYEGELVDFNENEIDIKVEENIVTIPREKISKTTLKGEL